MGPLIEHNHWEQRRSDDLLNAVYEKKNQISTEKQEIEKKKFKESSTRKVEEKLLLFVDQSWFLMTKILS